VTELDSLHKSELEAKLMEAQFQKEIWELEQDVQLDKIILEKMELKKVQERIKVRPGEERLTAGVKRQQKQYTAYPYN